MSREIQNGDPDRYRHMTHPPEEGCGYWSWREAEAVGGGRLTTPISPRCLAWRKLKPLFEALQLKWKRKLLPFNQRAYAKLP